MQSRPVKSILSTLLPFLLCWGTNGVSQTYNNYAGDSCFSGIYQTYDDYLHSRLSYKFQYKTSNYNISIIKHSNLLTVLTPDTLLKLNPGSIYGFIQCNKLYRFVSSIDKKTLMEGYYSVKETGGLYLKRFIIYSYTSAKGTEYFFSNRLDSPVFPLNMENIEKEYNELFPQFVLRLKEMEKQGKDINSSDKNGNFLIVIIYNQLTNGSN